MRTPLLKAFLLVALLGSSAGCVKRYADRPALEFSELDYSGPLGQTWPTKSVTLEGAQKRHNLSHAPVLRYVELNEKGTQTVVFLHGLGSYLKFWRAQLDAVAAQGYRVIAIDQLGFGKSDKPALFPYTTESFGENVVELLERLGIKDAILVGHSMGGQTALSTAIRFPDRVRALVLVSPAGFEVFSGREQKWFKNVYSRTLVKDADEESIWGNVRDYNFQRWSPDYEWLIEERVRLAKSPDFDAYAYAQVRTVEGLARNNFVRESLAKVTAPTLIVYGSGDRLIPNAFLHGGFTRTIMEAGQAGIANSHLLELKGCGHTLQLDCADAFNQALGSFLKSQSPGAPGPATPGKE